MAAKDETKPKIPGHEITCQLKLDTNAKGWHKTISKVLKTIEGVSYSIDMQNGSVTVTGMIDPQALMSRLRKSGKHAELIKVDSGVLREARIKKQQKQQQKLEQEEEYYKQYYYGHGYGSYGHANGYYPQQYGGYYNHSGSAGYPYGTTSDYYRSQYQPYPNYYQNQPARATAGPMPAVTHAPQAFPQPPPPMEIHPFYDPDTQCTIM